MQPRNIQFQVSATKDFKLFPVVPQAVVHIPCSNDCDADVCGMCNNGLLKNLNYACPMPQVLLDVSRGRAQQMGHRDLCLPSMALPSDGPSHV